MHAISPKNPDMLLPYDVLGEIFKHVDLPALGNCAQVDKECNQLASKLFDKERERIYQEVAFGPDKWEKYFSDFTLKPEEHSQAFKALSNKMIQIFSGPSNVFPNELVKDTEMLVWISEGLTLNKVGELAKQYFPGNADGFRLVWQPIVDELGDKLVERSGWVLMTNKMLPGSGGKSWPKQKRMVEDLASVPGCPYVLVRAVEAVACALSQFVAYGTRPFSDTYPRCEENVQGDKVVVGFALAGLHVYYNFNHDFVGVAALRKF